MTIFLILAILVGLITGLWAVYFISHPQPFVFNEEQRLLTKSEEVIELEPDGHMVMVDHRAIHYVQSGSGHDVVLIHGIAASTYTWRLLQPMLAKYYRVTAIDLPGFGKSGKDPNEKYNLDRQTEMVIKIIEELQLKKPHLVGSSMGGAISLWVKKTSPDKVGKVSVLAPAINPKVAKLIFNKLIHANLAYHFLVTKPFVKTVCKRVVNDHRLITDEYINSYQAPYKQKAAVQTFIKAIDLLKDRRLPADLSTITEPVQVLWGEHDRMNSLKYGFQLQAVLKNIDFHTHTTSGHHPMEDDPDWTFEKIHNFFQA